ncbi:hypothetical protein SmJEL517_g00465 [Synchytrium microbalum]|uniref:PCI domain-containing protein n=1 Tax=Synchytrium microbalum TaxID=1806994 RepID=A0A507CE06_9FUNG|nr:uncharacterized protein SmJEL517_g00465 [Synchytrium microbalum]TPX37409.1 hypothetical protein SmJEL517_g00465 [Synchytrium microbalum]
MSKRKPSIPSKSQQRAPEPTLKSKDSLKSPTHDVYSSSSSLKPSKPNATTKTSSGATKSKTSAAVAASTAREDDYEDDFEADGLDPAPPKDAYEEDFEGYDDDFEGFEEPEVPRGTKPELKKPGLVTESRSIAPAPAFTEPPISPISKSHARDDHGDEEGEETLSQQQPGVVPAKITKASIIDSNCIVVEPPLPTQALRRALIQRAKDLKSYVDLDFVSFDLFDLAPMNEYEVYIRNYGLLNAAQVGTQTNQDGVEQDAQTEDWLVEDKWSQAPSWELPTTSTTNNGYGNTPRTSRDNLNQDSSRLLKPAIPNPIRLDRFLQKARSVMEVLLDESNGDAGFGVFSEPSRLGCSSGFAEFVDPNLFADRRIQVLSIHGSDNQILLSAWSLPKKSSHKLLMDQGVVCLWRVSSPHVPYKILTCESYVTTACIMPYKPHLIIAGTRDGGVIVWDLHSSVDQSSGVSGGNVIVVEGQEISIIEPSYSTYGIHQPDRAHMDEIVSVIPLQKRAESLQTMQVMSIDASGHVQSWVLIELEQPATAASEHLDSGMRFGSRVKLIQSAGFQIRPPIKTNDALDMHVNAVAFSDDRGGFLVALHTGHILNVSRHGQVQAPRHYLPMSHMPGDAATCICIHPFLPRVFIVGYESGMMALFHTTLPIAVTTWPSSTNVSTSIKHIQWSRHRPSVFFALDDQGCVSVWDLSESDVGPCFQYGGDFKKKKKDQDQDVVDALTVSHENRMAVEAIKPSTPTVVDVEMKTPAELLAEANTLVVTGQEYAYLYLILYITRRDTALAQHQNSRNVMNWRYLTTSNTVDIKNNIALLERAVSEIETRFTTRVLRSTQAFRKRLNAEVLSQALNQHLAKDSHTKITLHAALGMGDVMEVDEVVNGHHPSSTAPTTPEVEIYLGMLVVLFIHDQKHYVKGKELTTKIIAQIQSLNRRTMDQIAARIYFYMARFYELTGDFVSVRPLLLAAHRTATLRHDPDTQATVLNLLLRSYLSANLYDQADKLISKAVFPETAPNNQHARFLYYQGRIKAIQLDYTEANRSLQQAIRKAPQTSAAAGFQQAVNKLAIIVQLLTGDIPERSIFRQPMLRKALLPYFEITQAVRSGNVNGFPKAVDEHKATFLADRTYTLILRLRHNVIKAGLRRISIAYSAISLRDICEKLKLDSEQDAEYIVAKSIRDGVIDATIVHEKGYMKSKEIVDLYSTNEPQNQFHQRITFCLDLHNESVKALRFPMNAVNKDLASVNAAREEERKLAREIADGDFDEDDDMGFE